MRRAWRATATAALTLAAAGCVPELGAVDGKIFGDAVRIHDPRFGSSYSPGVVLRIEVADHGDFAPAHVGHLVWDAFFRGSPPLVFNVSFACGASGPEGGTYADPESIWFNVFVGYYEIDVSKERWGRPFGYRFEGGDARIVLGDVLRIGKADWNYFSNYVYGVPLEAVRRHDSLSGARADYLGRVPVGAREWDLLELADVDVVSAYVSGADGQSLRENDPVSTPLWRRAFGVPRPRPDFPTSFVGTRVRARFYMSFTEGIDPHTHERVYRTTVFGGTTNEGYPHAMDNRRFLEAQLAAVRDVMVRRFPDLGFR